MKAKNLYIGKRVSSDGDHLYCVPVTRPDATPNFNDDEAIKLDFSEEDESPEDHIDTFWEKNTGIVASGSDQSTYSLVSPLEAYEVMEEYKSKVIDHLKEIQGTAVDQAEQRLESIK